jgi:hypothetical protein
MPTSLIKFEVRLPLATTGSAQDASIQSFLTSLAALTPYTFLTAYQVDASGSLTQYNLVFGLLTSAQASTALNLLTTLNAALGFNVLCYTWTVNQQP